MRNWYIQETGMIPFQFKIYNENECKQTVAENAGRFYKSKLAATSAIFKRCEDALITHLDRQGNVSL